MVTKNLETLGSKPNEGKLHFPTEIFDDLEGNNQKVFRIDFFQVKLVFFVAEMPEK